MKFEVDNALDDDDQEQLQTTLDNVVNSDWYKENDDSAFRKMHEDQDTTIKVTKTDGATRFERSLDKDGNPTGGGTVHINPNQSAKKDKYMVDRKTDKIIKGNASDESILIHEGVHAYQWNHQQDIYDDLDNFWNVPADLQPKYPSMLEHAAVQEANQYREKEKENLRYSYTDPKGVADTWRRSGKTKKFIEDFRDHRDNGGTDPLMIMTLGIRGWADNPGGAQDKFINEIRRHNKKVSN